MHLVCTVVCTAIAKSNKQVCVAMRCDIRLWRQALCGVACGKQVAADSKICHVRADFLLLRLLFLLPVTENPVGYDRIFVL